MQLASEIEGLVPEKKKVHPINDHYRNCVPSCPGCRDEGINEALDLISQKKLEVVIDRERLAKYMADDDKNWDTDDQFRNYWLDRADIVLQRANTDKELCRIGIVKGGVWEEDTNTFATTVAKSLDNLAI